MLIYGLGGGWKVVEFLKLKKGLYNCVCIGFLGGRVVCLSFIQGAFEVSHLYPFQILLVGSNNKIPDSPMHNFGMSGKA